MTQYVPQVDIKEDLDLILKSNNRQIASGSLLYSTGSSAQCSVVTSGAEGTGMGWEGGPRGSGVCIHTADSLLCMAETNTTL